MKTSNNKDVFIKRSILFMSIIFCSLIISGRVDAYDNEAEIKKAIQTELTLHSKATLLDLYKNFFQGRYGPGHIISSVEGASDYLKKELQEASKFDTVLWQPVGYEEKYYRINLSLVRDGKIDFQDLLKAFTENADTLKLPSIVEWEKEWNSILGIIEEMNLNLPGFEKDKQQIAENIKKGIVIGHHSVMFEEHYNPHYRLVPKAQFIRLQTILLEKSKTN